MAIQTQHKEIDGHKYSVTTFNGLEGVKVKAILMRHLGPSLFSLGMLGVGSKKNFTEMDIDPLVMTKLFEDLFTRLDENQYATFILRLLSCTLRDNVAIDEELFKAAFAAEYGTLYKVLFFVLEVNYKKSFFGEGGIGNFLKGVQNLMPQDNGSTTNSPQS